MTMYTNAKAGKNAIPKRIEYLLFCLLVLASFVSALDLSGKSIEELNALHIELNNQLADKDPDMTGYDRTVFERDFTAVMDMRTKELDASWKRTDPCYAACSGEKFQRGGGGQACVQPCLDRADAEGKRILAEIDRAERQAYIKDINALEAALNKAGTKVIVEPEPVGPKFNTYSGRGRTEFDAIAPSFSGYRGDAYVTRSDGTRVIPGKELYLRVDDKVVTGKESKVNIMFGNAGSMNLGPNTELRVGTALLDQYYLAKGSLKTSLSFPAHPVFKIDTPNAAVSMRGTEFVVDYNSSTNITSVYLYSGLLEVTSSSQILNLTEGNSCTIDSLGEIISYRMKPSVWNSMDDRFLADSSTHPLTAYAWATFLSIIISSLLSNLFFYIAKKKHKNSDYGIRSIVFGTLGIITCMFPIIGFPLSAAGTTLARIQKIRKSTTSAKIGYWISLLGVMINGFVGIIFFFYVIAM